MVRIRCTRPSWGAVRDPKSGEHVSISDDVDPAVAERLVAEYGPLSVEGEDDDAPEDLDKRAIGLADEGYEDVVDAVEAGDADAFLDDLEQADDRATVQDAIDERRDELEGE